MLSFWLFLRQLHVKQTASGRTPGRRYKADSIYSTSILPSLTSSISHPASAYRRRTATMSPSVIPLTCLLILTCTTVLVRSQSIIPSRYDGFVYKKRAASTATVMIEAFFDPVCPDSRDSWAPLKQAVDYYGPTVVSLIVHTFPLPYHDNAFVTSRALHIVNELNASATYRLLDAFFKNQGQFYNAQTLNMSREAVLDQVIGFASSALGNSMQSAIRSGFNDSKTGTKTRVSFKYGCSRGVYGTPFFFVNGFLVPFNDADTIDYNGWRKLIDPLITKQQSSPSNVF